MNKNHIVSFALLAFICLPTSTFIYLQVSNLMAKHEMLERLENSNLQEITIAKKDVRWYEEGKEIIIGGSMFDVKSCSAKNDSITFTGLFDEKESLLKKKIDLLIDYQNTNATSNTLTVAQLVFQLWYHGISEYILIHPTIHLEALNDRTLKQKVLLSPVAPPSPPPKTS